MEKSRIIAQMDILDKLLSARSSSKSKEDELVQFRNVTSKILNLLEGSEQSFRDAIIKNPNQVDSLINALQIYNDSQVTKTVIKIIHELVGRSTGQKRAQVFVHHGATKAVLQCIYLESKEYSPSEEYLFLLHQVVYRIGVKDRKIGVLARLSQCLPVIVTLLRTQINLIQHNRGSSSSVSISSIVSKNILNLLNVVRLYSQNLINASRLGRNGLIALLLKMISYSGKNNLSILRISLETLNLCVRTKSNGARAINHGAMAMLLQLFLDWERIDSRDKQLSLRRSILSVIKNLINLRAGRKAFLDADGLHTFFKYCEASKCLSNVESIVILASLILRKCFPKNRLPLSHYDSTLRCPLQNTLTREKSKSLLEFRKDASSPGTQSTTSQIDLSPLIPFLGCQGDSDLSSGPRKWFNREIGLDSMDLKHDGRSEFSTANDNTKENKRFRSLDRKLSESQCKSAAPIRHHNFLGRYMRNTNASQSDIRDEDEEYLADELEMIADKAGKDEREEQSLVDRILMNGSGYQPPDDRSLDKLKDSYDKFLFERDIFKNETQRKPSTDVLEDILDNNTKRKETVQPSLVSLQMKGGFTPERKLSRSTISKNEVSIAARTIEVCDERNVSLTCTGIGIQRSGQSISQTNGLYQRSKRLSLHNKHESINITNLINDLADNSEKPSIVPKKAMSGTSSISHTKEEFMQTYIHISSVVTKSLGPFNMIAYPDLFEQSFMMKQPEPLTETFIQNQGTSNSDNGDNKRGRTNSLPQTKKLNSKTNTANKCVQRPSSASANADSLAQNKILEDLRRIIDSEDIIDKVVYDLDDIVNKSSASYNLDGSTHSNSDELELNKTTSLISGHLRFDSQFESGNLRKVIHVRQYEYDLILSPDVNTNNHTQWFYFRVSAMETGVKYRFNIINCEKPNSQFNFGMQPLLYSVKEAVQGRGCWKRWGSEIFYYKNHFARSAATCGGNLGKSYFTCTFLIEFPNDGDICYMAYHYPYTFTRLLTDIHLWTRKLKSSKNAEQSDCEDKKQGHKIEFQTNPDDGILFSVQELCRTILKNPVPLITITNWPKDGADHQMNPKQYVFLSSRVHPGESNASWVIKGCIDFLISDNPVASQLRDSYIFKIVPMLNPDGVINGCYRCSMAGQDLNRRWLDPCDTLNPTIYNTKGLLMYLSKLGQTPVVYCDFHGHSRRKNVFMFGCSPLQSWISEDSNNPSYIDQKTEDLSLYSLPNVLNKIAQQFSLDCCNFSIDKSKESTARVVVWRQFGIKRSYTMESSFCSCDQGSYKNLHINVPMLEDMGLRFAESLLHLDELSSVPIQRNVTLPTRNTNDKVMSFKTDASPTTTKCKRLHSITNQKSAVKGMDNDDEDDEEDEDAVSDNEDDDVEEESDKEKEYVDDYCVEDSD